MENLPNNSRQPTIDLLDSSSSKVVFEEPEARAEERSNDFRAVCSKHYYYKGLTSNRPRMSDIALPNKTLPSRAFGGSLQESDGES